MEAAKRPSKRQKQPSLLGEILLRVYAPNTSSGRPMPQTQYTDPAALQVLEVGKGWAEADADVTEAIDYLEYYGREMINLGRPRKMAVFRERRTFM